MITDYGRSEKSLGISLELFIILFTPIRKFLSHQRMDENQQIGSENNSKIHSEQQNRKRREIDLEWVAWLVIHIHYSILRSWKR